MSTFAVRAGSIRMSSTISRIETSGSRLALSNLTTTSGKGGKSSGRKSGLFNREGIEKLAADKPAVYKLLDPQGANLYTCIAKRGRVQERLKEHLSGGKDPIRGAKKVELLQKSSIDEAKKTESRILSRSKPPRNKQGT